MNKETTLHLIRRAGYADSEIALTDGVTCTLGRLLAATDAVGRRQLPYRERLEAINLLARSPYETDRHLAAAALEQAIKERTIRQAQAFREINDASPEARREETQHLLWLFGATFVAVLAAWIGGEYLTLWWIK